LEGLVNLFDLDIVLAVVFLLAGLGLTLDARTGRVEPRAPDGGRQEVVRVPTDPTAASGGSDPLTPAAASGGSDPLTPAAASGGSDPLTPAAASGGSDPLTPAVARWRGDAVGTVYRLPDGRLVLVKPQP
jgi:hypothetical protein